MNKHVTKVNGKFQQLQSLIDGIKDCAILMLDKDGAIKTWSAAAESIFGYGAAEVHGKLWSDFYSSEDIATGLPNRDIQIASSHGIYENTNWRVRKNRSRVWINTVICPLRSQQGKLKGFSVVMRDMTERHTSEELLKAKERELEQAKRMESIGRLAGGVAHHFNNLITGIMVVTQAVCKRMAVEDPSRQELEEVIQAAGRAAGLTRQLLAFGRRQVASAKMIDFNKVVSDTKNMLRRLLPESIELATHLALGPLSVYADPAQMDQIIIELVLNARDAMAGGGRLTIETDRVSVSADEGSQWGLRPGSYISATISDTGVGIAKERMPYLFEPFNASQESSRGTGLGLASVYGIVKQNKGHISVQSQSGKGTMFKILWPASVENPASAGVTELQSRAPAREANSILLVEDEAIVRRAVCRLLKLEGYEVHEAANGRKATEEWERMPNPPDLLLTDIVMPEMTGGQLAEWVRVRRPQIAVLFMSGYSEEILSHRIVLDRNTDFIEKPFSDEQFLAKIEGVLNASTNVENAGGGSR